MWKVLIEVEAQSFDMLKGFVRDFLRGVEKAKTYEDFTNLRTVGSQHSGFGRSPPDATFRMESSTPVEAKIIQLRKEADTLEKELGR